MIGQYAHGNEPSHHVAYFYNFLNRWSTTQRRVHQIMRSFYNDTPAGLCGNEDCGQMSAWLVSSALGFYQVNPSNGVYVFGSPAYKRATITLKGGRKFTVTASNNSDRNVYIKSVTLNGKPYTKSYITYDDIMRGGTLAFTMSSKPNKKFGASKADRPVSAR